MINIWGLIYNISISSLIGLLFSPPIHTTTNTFLVISSQRFHCSLRLRVVGFSSPLTALERGLVEGASEKGAQIGICSIWEVDRNAATSNKNLFFQLILTNLVCLSALLCAIVNEWPKKYTGIKSQMGGWLCPKRQDDRNRGIKASISKTGSLIRAMYVCQTPIMWITTQIWREIWFQSQIWPPQGVLVPTIFQEHVVWGNWLGWEGVQNCRDTLGFDGFLVLIKAQNLHT